MDPKQVFLAPGKAVTVANEFAGVRVEIDYLDGRPIIEITDLGTGVKRQLSPMAALERAAGPSLPISPEGGEIKAAVGYAANGPRLEIFDVQTGLAVYLDPLELSDAAVSGEWGRLPDVFNK